MARLWGLVLAPLMIAGCLDQRFVYYPTPWEEGDWAARSGLPIQDVEFRASDGARLHGWLVEAPDSPATVLWCHGNAANVINRLDHLAQWHRRGVSVFIFDYRGYGRSEGSPSEPGLYRDALAAYELLTRSRGVRPERLVVYGQSLGAGVAGEVAAQRSMAGLILEAPFPSVSSVVRAYYGRAPLHWLLAARYDLAARLRRIRAPVLVIHGDRDRIIPFELGRQVFAAAGEPKAFYQVSGADHNDVYVVGGEAYFARIIGFINDVAGRGAMGATTDQAELRVGQPAPEFSLPGDDGRPVRLSEFRGKQVVLYFYPKDDTPGCTKQACAFRDAWKAIQDRGAVVMGISADPVASHRTFKEKYALSFPLLSDESRSVLKAYGVWKAKSLYGRSYEGIERTTLIIDGQGRIATIFPKVKVDGHIDEVLAALGGR